MRSAHFLWRSCHVQCDSTSEPTSGKQFARTLVRACKDLEGWQRWQSPRGYLLRGASAGVTISQSRPIIELRDLPTEGGRQSVPVSRTPSLPVRSPITAKIRSSVACPCAGLRLCGVRRASTGWLFSAIWKRGSAGVPFPALALDCDSAGFVVPVQDSCWDETERSSLQRRLLARDNHEVIASAASLPKASPYKRPCKPFP